eukprot:g3853.t1
MGSVELKQNPSERSRPSPAAAALTTTLPAEPRPRPCVAVLGLACIDIVAVLDAYPSRDTKNVTKERHLFGGGNGATVAIALARLFGSSRRSCDRLSPLGQQLSSPKGQGGEECVRFAVPLFGDSDGDFVRAELTEHHIDTALYADFRPAGRTGSSYIILDEATKSRTIFHTPQEPRELRWNAEMAEAFLGEGQNVKCLFTDGRFEQTALKFLELARGRKIPVLMDCERLRSPETVQMLDYCSVVSCSETFLAILRQNEERAHLVSEGSSQQQDNAVERAVDKKGKIQKAAEELCWFARRSSTKKARTTDCGAVAGGTQVQVPLEFAVVTLGEHGVVCYDMAPPGRVFHVPSWVPSGQVVVDTCGAGDAFNGGLVFAYAQGRWSVLEMVLFAIAVAGHSVTALGARTALPTLDEEWPQCGTFSFREAMDRIHCDRTIESAVELLENVNR